MVYATVYGFRITGKVIAGPNAGREFAAHCHEVPDYYLPEAVVRAQGYAGIFVGTVEVFSCQWCDEKPGILAAGQTWEKGKKGGKGKGGLLYTWNLETIHHNAPAPAIGGVK